VIYTDHFNDRGRAIGLLRVFVHASATVYRATCCCQDLLKTLTSRPKPCQQGLETKTSMLGSFD